MQAAVIGFTDPSAHPLLVYSIATPWIEILNSLERDPLFLEKITPRQLEELVAEAYRRQGYKDVILTPYSNDRGRDVIVSATVPGIGMIKIVDQVKRYTAHRKVTADDVRALYGVMFLDPSVSKGIVTTTSDFAPGIQDEFKRGHAKQIGVEKWARVERVAKGTVFEREEMTSMGDREALELPRHLSVPNPTPALLLFSRNHESAKNS